MMKRVGPSLWGVAAVLLAAAPMVVAGSDEGTLATVSVAGSRAYWTPVASFACLELTVTTPDPNQTIEKKFAAGESPSIELATGAVEGTYRWRLSRSDKPCAANPTRAVSYTPPSGPAVAAAAGADDRNGRSAARQGRPERAPSGPYLQSGLLLVQQGSFVAPSSAPERSGRR